MPTSSSSAGRRGILAPFDPWKSPLCTCPFKLSLNPYTGCSFKCIYCYATAYIGLRESAPKRDFVRRLRRDMARWPPPVIVNIGTSSDPYPPIEAFYRLTRAALEELLPRGYRVLVTTKGTLYAKRDIDLLAAGNAAVTPTITTLSEPLARLLEPGAPSPESRLRAAAAASRAGVPVAARLDPVIPFYNDDEYELRELVGRLADAGARFIVTSTFKGRPDSLARFRSLGAAGERLYKLYREKGVRIGGYIYLPRAMRERLLHPVVDEARKLGLEYATCREGLRGKEWFNAGSCDGSHLIPSRVRPRVARLDTWHSRGGTGTGVD